ncbi:hypothetical protein D3C78_1180230 [compost metagenome]
MPFPCAIFVAKPHLIDGIPVFSIGWNKAPFHLDDIEVAFIGSGFDHCNIAITKAIMDVLIKEVIVYNRFFQIHKADELRPANFLSVIITHNQFSFKMSLNNRSYILCFFSPGRYTRPDHPGITFHSREHKGFSFITE